MSSSDRSNIESNQSTTELSYRTTSHDLTALENIEQTRDYDFTYVSTTMADDDIQYIDEDSEELTEEFTDSSESSAQVDGIENKKEKISINEDIEQSDLHESFGSSELNEQDETGESNWDYMKQVSGKDYWKNSPNWNLWQKIKKALTFRDDSRNKEESTFKSHLPRATFSAQNINN